MTIQNTLRRILENYFKILGNLDKYQEAIRVAGQALEIDPYDILALNARSRAYIDLHDWTDAESNARHTLELDAHNEVRVSELDDNLFQCTTRYDGRSTAKNAWPASS